MAAGLSPRDVEAATLWEFTAALNGWLQSKGVEEKPDLLSDEALDEIAEFEARFA